jgi:hypothetical protein
MSEHSERLEYLRGELRAERLSWGGVLELQDLAAHIETGDVELLEAAGVSETPDLELDLGLDQPEVLSLMDTLKAMTEMAKLAKLQEAPHE